jgi:uncharacterized protein (DUF58 family)
MALRARLVVEGFILGLHRSPYHGFSVEFAEHRPYMPGDEIRYIDWKLYSKTDRYYIKEFEEETNLKSYLLLDKSASMAYHSGPVSKLTYGCYLAAALSYLMLKQQDATSLALFDTQIRTLLPPLAKKSHLNQILSLLEKTEPGQETSIAPLLHELAEKLKKRGLIILISDLLDDPEQILNGLKHFRHKKHELIVFHILDPQEIKFSFNRQTQFLDLETKEFLMTEPWHIQIAYQQAMNRFINNFKTACFKNRIDYKLIITDQLLDIALSEYLSKRGRLG